jgi:hypothetical protein
MGFILIIFILAVFFFVGRAVYKTSKKAFRQRDLNIRDLEARERERRERDNLN